MEWTECQELCRSTDTGGRNHLSRRAATGGGGAEGCSGKDEEAGHIARYNNIVIAAERWTSIYVWA